MTKTDSSATSELKTIGLTPLIYCSDQALFNVRAGVPIVDALSQASDLLFLARSFAQDAAFAKGTDRHAWAAHYLTAMSKAVIDDVVKVLTPRPARTKTKSEDPRPESN
ncbi:MULTISPECIES: DUF3077 domain-containing protein [Pseudomonas]|uniref:DUF3077 domain-containing protein n=1 Tax=Pseudomonas TaxID=286 RepID=UPI000CD1231E|nr:MULTISPECIES: DUF3077 domain-containing protein [unclassified Pseudomonas]POA33007.1 hypothetical protein C1887_07695 [Pseudomonas sp. GW456-R21]POA69515.1 hypothetical protein C1884_06235 [Pseudomonas sp. GW460-R15]